MMNKIIFLIVVMTINAHSYDDGIDKVTIYLNDTIITTTNDLKNKEITINVKKEDTIKFVVWTDWGGQINSTIEIKGKDGVILNELTPLRDYKYEKTFLLTHIDKKLINNKIGLTLFYNPEMNVKPWEFCKIILKRDEGSR